LKLARKILAGQEDELILLEGVRLVEEGLRSEVGIVEALYTRRFADGDRGAEVLAGITEKVFEDAVRDATECLSEVDEDVFATVTDTKTSQGIVMICRRPSTAFEDFTRHTSSAGGLFVALHEINNPSNLGAILRTAEAAGVAGVITTKSSADVFSAKSLRAGLGSNLRVPLWTGASFADVIAWAKERDLAATAADAHASLSYRDVDWSRPRVVVFGSEAHGLSPEELSMIDERMTIPMANGVESLNLAVSAGIILFEAKS
jgi:TrmH family RNA methyltransferase